jgi:hypothetical protein
MCLGCATLFNRVRIFRRIYVGPSTLPYDRKQARKIGTQKCMLHDRNRKMSCHALMKATLLTVLLLFVWKSSTEGQRPRLLGGVSDRFSVGVEQGSKQDLDQGKPLYHQDANSAGGRLRQLDERRPVPTHHPLDGASTSARAHSRSVPYKKRNRMKAPPPITGDLDKLSRQLRASPSHAASDDERDPPSA